MAETDAAVEQLAASHASSPTSADAEAARQMEEMQAAIDAERAERAASEVSTASAGGAVTPPQPERRGLAVRTSVLCEFRDSGGRLQAFEVCSQAPFGVLCEALSRMSGVEFHGHAPTAWFRRPSRFSFRGQLYEISIPHQHICVAPVNGGEAVVEMEELLDYVRRNVLKAQKSQYVTMGMGV